MSEQTIKNELYHKLLSCNHNLSKINAILNEPTKYKGCFTTSMISKILGIPDHQVKQIERSALRKIKRMNELIFLMLIMQYNN